MHDVLPKLNPGFESAIDELLELHRLGDNWDGEGAVAPLPELVDSAIDLIRKQIYPEPPSRIVPVNDGRVTLEWYSDGNFLSVRVESPQCGRQMVVKSDGTTEFSEVQW